MRLGHWFWDIRAGRPRGGPAWKLLRRLVRRTAAGNAPSLSKVPLLRWGADIRIEDAQAAAFHAVAPPVALSRCWAGILHFKFLGDFPERVAAHRTGSLSSESRRLDLQVRTTGPFAPDRP